MNIKKTIAFAVAISSIALNAYSAQSGYVQINRVATLDDGTVILYSNNGWGNAASNSCSNGTGVIAFKANTDGGKSLLSTALAAYVSQKTVLASTYDSTCSSVGGWAPTVQRLDVMN